MQCVICRTSEATSRLKTEPSFVVCDACRARADTLMVGVRRKPQAINLALRWNVDVRELIQDTLRKRASERPQHKGLVPWLERMLTQRFTHVDPFPNETLEIRAATGLPDGEQQRGIWARVKIERGTRVAAYRGAQVSFDESGASHANDRTFSVAIAPQVAMTVTSQDWPSLFNHQWMWPRVNDEGLRTGVAPFAWQRYFANVVVDDELQLWALRDIERDEELTYDYGLAYWAEAPSKPLWDVSDAPAELMEALRADPSLRLLALASGVRRAPGEFIDVVP